MIKKYKCDICEGLYEGKEIIEVNSFNSKRHICNECEGDVGLSIQKLKDMVGNRNGWITFLLFVMAILIWMFIGVAGAC